MVAGIFQNSVVVISLWRSTQLLKKLCYYLIFLLSCFDLAVVSLVNPACNMVFHCFVSRFLRRLSLRDNCFCHHASTKLLDACVVYFEFGTLSCVKLSIPASQICNEKASSTPPDMFMPFVHDINCINVSKPGY